MVIFINNDFQAKQRAKIHASEPCCIYETLCQFFSISIYKTEKNTHMEGFFGIGFSIESPLGPFP